MRMVVYGFMALGLSLGVGSMVLSRAEEKKDAPSMTIKEVMEQAHKGGLLKKVVSGKATDEDRNQLVIGYTALSLNKPPKGDAAGWKTKTDTLVDAAKAVAKDPSDKTAVTKLQKASNCMACHKEHKPPS